MKKLIVLVGPQGSGKTIKALELEKEGYFRISQDDMGKQQHFIEFQNALNTKDAIVIDRINHTKEQRERYLKPAKAHGFVTEIHVLHVPKYTCFKRCINRKDHPTIKDAETANKAINNFFERYEKPEPSEADIIVNYGHDNIFTPCIVIDLDGTLCDINHRLHLVKENKDWKTFFQKLTEDKVNVWCKIIIDNFHNYPVVLASGRPDDYQDLTMQWLIKNNISYDMLFMRPSRDYRKDSIVKEIILDFEILTRYNPLFFVDDRQQVVDMYRNRGFTVLQCDKGDF